MNKLLLLSNEAIPIAVRDFIKLYHILGVKLVLKVGSCPKDDNSVQILYCLFQCSI